MLHRIVSRSAVVLAATAFLASCEDNTSGSPQEPPPASTAVVVKAVDPVPDSGVVDTDLAEPVVVKVTNPDGSPAPSVVVTFGLTTGGLIEHTQVTTDANGLASPGIWHLGKKAGLQRLTATPPSGDPAIVNVTAVPGPFAQLDAPSGLPNSSQIANKTTAIAPVFVAVDSFGNRVVEPIVVNFEAVEGSIDDTSDSTSANGDVSPGAWTLDGTIGPQRLVAVYDLHGDVVHDTITVEAVCTVTRASFGVSVNGQWRTTDCDNGTRLVNVYSFAPTTQTAYNASISGAPGQALQLKTSTGTIIQDVLPSYLYSTTSNPYSINYVLQTGSYESWALAPGMTAALYSGMLTSFGGENGVDDYLPSVGCAEVGDTPVFATIGLDAFATFAGNTCNAGGYATYQDRYLVQLSAGDEIEAVAIQSAGMAATTVLSLRIRDARTAAGAIVATGVPAGATGANARTLVADYTAAFTGLYEVIVGSPVNVGLPTDDDPPEIPDFEYEVILTTP